VEEEKAREDGSFQLREFRFEKTYCTLVDRVYIECTKALGTAARLLCESPNGRWVMMSTKDCTSCLILSPWYSICTRNFRRKFRSVIMSH